MSFCIRSCKGVCENPACWRLPLTRIGAADFKGLPDVDALSRRRSPWAIIESPLLKYHIVGSYLLISRAVESGVGGSTSREHFRVQGEAFEKNGSLRSPKAKIGLKL